MAFPEDHAPRLEQRLAERRYWAPKSDWITFRTGSEHDLKRWLCLMRLSYLRYLRNRVNGAIQ